MSNLGLDILLGSGPMNPPKKKKQQQPKSGSETRVIPEAASESAETVKSDAVPESEPQKQSNINSSWQELHWSQQKKLAESLADRKFQSIAEARAFLEESKDV